MGEATAQAVAEILRSGILGALLVLALYVIYRLDTERKAERTAHADEVRKLEDEKQALLERVLASKETDAQKLREVVAAISRRYERDSDRRDRDDR